MTWKRRTLAVLCFAVMALGFYANGGVYVTPQNIIVLLAFFWALHNFRVVLSLGSQDALSALFQVCAVTVWPVALRFFHIRWIAL